MANSEYILKHYKKVAQAYGKSGSSSMHDPYIREAEWSFFHGEIFQFIAEKERMPRVLDLGCGNGQLLISLRKAFPEANYLGIELSPEMLFLASDESIEWRCADMLAVELPEQSFDIIITERSLINLPSARKQRQMYHKIFQWLQDDGRYLMVESFKAPLEHLNRARAEFTLPALSISAHNCYLSGGTLGILEHIGLVHGQAFLPANYLSTHFYTTRVLHPLHMQAGSKVKNSSLVSFFNQALPSSIGDYSPIKFYRFHKGHSNETLE
jgi:ubiquinone/menaquinone biosynthesis C-methylase UbiE